MKKRNKTAVGRALLAMAASAPLPAAGRRDRSEVVGEELRHHHVLLLEASRALARENQRLREGRPAPAPAPVLVASAPSAPTPPVCESQRLLEAQAQLRSLAQRHQQAIELQTRSNKAIADLEAALTQARSENETLRAAARLHENKVALLRGELGQVRAELAQERDQAAADVDLRVFVGAMRVFVNRVCELAARDVGETTIAKLAARSKKKRAAAARALPPPQVPLPQRPEALMAAGQDLAERLAGARDRLEQQQTTLLAVIEALVRERADGARPLREVAQDANRLADELCRLRERNAMAELEIARLKAS